MSAIKVARQSTSGMIAPVLGVLPFTLALPHAGLAATAARSAVSGAVISSIFPPIAAYAQELIPGHTGMVSGLFFDLISGIDGALLGSLADAAGIHFVFDACYAVAIIGMLTASLVNIESLAHRQTACVRGAKIDEP